MPKECERSLLDSDLHYPGAPAPLAACDNVCMSTVPLGPFLLSERIGVGGMGEVWRGHHVQQRVPVAVKVITATRARQQKYHDAFTREVRAVAGLEHPGLVMVFDYTSAGSC